jgi:hypothetical protein
LWLPWSEVPIYYKVPFIYDHGPVRIDSLIYNACVKLEHIDLVLILHILIPFKKQTRIMLIAFGMAFIEFFFTWNEPVAKIPLPFHWWIPISTATLRFASICYLMVVVVRTEFKEYGIDN